ncbi:hypothetical protein nrt1_55760 [Pseudomonas aeruginosa]|nr:hypothetical protein VNPA110517_59570 [Pseudomonas aeruginosa]GLF54268.1 hypothetical protein VNPA141818_47760 [Pseudomonas aeruginosa]
MVPRRRPPLSIVPIAVFRRLGADARPRRHDDPPRPGDEAAFVFMQFAYTPARREKTGACAISATSTHIPAAASYTASKPRAAPDDRASGTAKTKDS